MEQRSGLGEGKGVTPMATSGKGNDFTREPGGGGGRGTRPRDLTAKQVPPRRSVQPTEVADLAADTVPEGGLLPFTAPKPIDGHPTGVGTIGDSQKPFRLDGGG